MSDACVVCNESSQGPCDDCGVQLCADHGVTLGGRWLCGDCKSGVARTMDRSAPSESETRFAGFWIRLAALIVDGLAVGVPMIAINMGILFGFADGLRSQGVIFWNVVIQIIDTLIFASYVIGMNGARGQTLGKMAAKIKIVQHDGSDIDYGIAFKRYFIKSLWISILQIIALVALGPMGVFVGYIGGIWVLIDCVPAAFHEKKWAMHDRFGNTQVVYV